MAVGFGIMNGIYLAEGLALIIDIDVTIVVSFYLSSIYLIYLSLFYNILLAGFPPQYFLSTQWNFLQRESCYPSTCVKTRFYFPHPIPPAGTFLCMMQRIDEKTNR